MSARVIVERKRRLDGTSVEFRCEPLIVEPGARAVLRFVTPSERRLEGTDLTLAAGTVTIGHFHAGRAYTVYAFTKEGDVIATYCSIVDEMSIAVDGVDYLDLAVDVLIDRRGNATVLDEDELPDDLEPRHRRTINTALEELTGNTRRLLAEVGREVSPWLRPSA